MAVNSTEASTTGAVTSTKATGVAVEVTITTTEEMGSSATSIRVTKETATITTAVVGPGYSGAEGDSWAPAKGSWDSTGTKCVGPCNSGC